MFRILSCASSSVAALDGNIITEKITDRVAERAIMNQLLVDVRVRAKIDYEDSKKAIRDLPTSLNEKLGLELKLELKDEKLAKLAEAY